MDRFIPENEQGVFYLFSRNHEKLGFERVISVDSNRTPDVFALRDGKTVGIELEYKSSSVLEHYHVIDKDQRGLYSLLENEWSWGDCMWYLKNKSNSRIIYKKKDEKHDKYLLDPNRNLLLYRTVKNTDLNIDYIIYWIKTDDFYYEHFDEKVKSINLSKISGLI